MDYLSVASSLFLILFFDSLDTFVQIYWTVRSFLLKHRTLGIDTANLRHRNAEGSQSRCRTFGQLVESNKSFSICDNEFQKN
ncbi:MAG: hypothetical protein II386_00770 [Bacteroidaceae bacterium]|nr:hypothetical protein [Bacteroidaceae bacterium]